MMFETSAAYTGKQVLLTSRTDSESMVMPRTKVTLVSLVPFTARLLQVTAQEINGHSAHADVSTIKVIDCSDVLYWSDIATIVHGI
jgi:hypothetical protein